MPHHDPNTSLIKRFVVFATLLMLIGCVGGGRPLPVETAPWYLQNSGAHYAADDRVFYGIGKAGGSRSQTLLRATAANRARKEMVKVLDQYVVALFQRSGAMTALTMEDGEQVIGALVSNAVKQSMISDQWRDDEQEQLYVLCRLDLNAFKQMLASQAVLDVKARASMLAEAEKVHTLLVGP